MTVSTMLVAEVNDSIPEGDTRVEIRGVQTVVLRAAWWTARSFVPLEELV